MSSSASSSSSSSSASRNNLIIVRVQTKVGTWRIHDVSLDNTFAQLKERILAEHDVAVEHQKISRDIRGLDEIDNNRTLRDERARNGHRVFFVSDVEFGASGGTGVKTSIDAKGNLILKTAGDEKRGFRPGLLPLSNIKRSWGIGELDNIDSDYTYHFKDPVSLECEVCVMDPTTAEIFVTYAKRTKFKPRVAFLYGRYPETGDGKTAVVHTSYEPPQKTDEFGNIEVLPETPESKRKLDAVVAGLGLTKIGCMFCHPFRNVKFDFSSVEALFAAEQQLESCDGDIEAKPNRFVSVVVRQTEDGLADFQAYQMTRQCMEMVAKGMLLWGMEDPYECDIHETFTAYTVKQNKEKTRATKSVSKSVPVQFLVQNVALKSKKCPYLVPLDFPIANRPGLSTGHEVLSHYLRSHGGKAYGEKLADFQVLVALGEIFGPEDMMEICQFVVQQAAIELGEGYKMVLDSL